DGGKEGRPRNVAIHHLDLCRDVLVVALLGEGDRARTDPADHRKPLPRRCRKTGGEKSGKQQRGKRRADSRDHGSPPFGAGGWRTQRNQELFFTPLLRVLLALNQIFVVGAAKCKKARQTMRSATLCLATKIFNKHV